MVSVRYVDNLMFWINKIGSNDWLGYTDAQISLLDKAFGEKGIPVFLGETTSRYPSERFAKGAVYKSNRNVLRSFSRSSHHMDLFPRSGT